MEFVVGQGFFRCGLAVFDQIPELRVLIFANAAIQ